MKSKKHTHTLKFAVAANAVVCIYCDFRKSEMDVLRVLAMATESGLTQRVLDVAYCACETKTVYINRICQTCGKPHALRQ